MPVFISVQNRHAYFILSPHHLTFKVQLPHYLKAYHLVIGNRTLSGAHLALGLKVSLNLSEPKWAASFEAQRGCIYRGFHERRFPTTVRIPHLQSACYLSSRAQAKV